MGLVDVRPILLTGPKEGVLQSSSRIEEFHDWCPFGWRAKTGQGTAKERHNGRMVSVTNAALPQVYCSAGVIAAHALALWRYSAPSVLNSLQ